MSPIGQEHTFTCDRSTASRGSRRACGKDVVAPNRLTVGAGCASSALRMSWQLRAELKVCLRVKVPVGASKSSCVEGCWSPSCSIASRLPVS